MTSDWDRRAVLQSSTAVPSASAPEPPALGYVPALDGLRGVLVLTIIAYHFNVGWASGGFLALSAFFTLSGFLITTLLIQEFDQEGRIGLRRFWVRRLRRLIPAATATIALVVLIGLLGGWSDSQRSGLRTGVPAALFEVANWQMIRSSASYSDLFSGPSPLQHFWSLAVEEQFYWVFPVVLVGLMSWLRLRTRVMGWCLLALAAGSAALMWWLSFHSSVDRVYLGTDTRLGELLAGAAFAALVFGRWRRGGFWVDLGLAVSALLSLIALGWAWSTVHYGDLGVFRGGLVLHVAGVIVIIAASIRHNPIANLLSMRPLVWIGRVSYGLYLIHWPVLVWSDHIGLSKSIGRPAATVLVLTLIFLIAACSYYVLETRIRHSIGAFGRTVGPRLVAVTGVGALAAVLAVMPTTSEVADPFSGGIPDPEPVVVSSTPNVSSQLSSVPQSERPLNVLIVGDSVAHGLALGMYGAHDPAKVTIIDGTSGGCGTIRTGKVAIHTAWVDVRPFCSTWEDKLDRYRPDVVIILRVLADLSDWQISDERMAVGDTTFDSMWIDQYTSDLQRVRASGAVTIAALPPKIDPSYGGSARDPERFDHLRSLITSAAQEAGADTLDVQARADSLGIEARADGVHFSVEDNARLSTDVLGVLIERGQEGRTGQVTVPEEHKPILVVGPSLSAGIVSELQRFGHQVVAAIADCPTTDAPVQPECVDWRTTIDNWRLQRGHGTVVVVPFVRESVWNIPAIQVYESVGSWLTWISGPDVDVVFLPPVESLVGPSTEENNKLAVLFAQLQSIDGVKVLDVARPSDAAAWAAAVEPMLGTS